jgi:hypothetical protein
VSIFLPLWAVLLVLPAWAAPNLLANNGFEDAREGLPVAWTANMPAQVALREDGGHGGQRYLRLTDPDAKTGLTVESERLPCRPNGTYTGAAWFRTGDRCSPGLYLNFYDDGGTRLHHLYRRAAGPTAGWVRVQTQTTAPPDAATVSVTIYAYIGDVGMFDADDVSLTVEGGGEPGSGGIAAAATGTKTAVDLGDRRELFVDTYLVDGLSGAACRRLHHPQRRAVALELNAPWEGPTSAYFSVVPVDGKIRLYYRGSGQEGSHELACVAESEDGITFTRPKLGLFDWQGSKDNSIIWMGAGQHNFTPFLDANPAAPADQRFKALASAGPKSSLVAFVSADGYRWRKLREEPVITQGAFDSQNLAFWDPVRKLYVEYHRGFRDGFRDIMTSTSADFVNWTEPQWLDYGDAPHEHLYTNAITPYFRAPHLHLGFPNRLMEGRQKIANAPGGAGVNDALLMSSRDMLHFERWREAFITPTLEPENWTDRNNYVAWGIVPLNEREIGIYSTDHYRHKTARLVVNTIRTDGFVSLSADASGGQALTRPFTFAGKALEVNYATSAAGSLRFELCDTEGKAYPGFALGDSEVLFGNELAHGVTWKGGSDVSSLAGKTVRLRVNLKDADLFSLRFIE